MTESAVTASAGASALRQAREARGLSIESLAATLKVSPAKLQALENGAHEALPDLAFARALAKTVCRHLGIDADPILATLPSAQPVNLAASDPKGVPFKATKARLNLDASASWSWQPLMQARWLVPLGILAAAALLHFWPQDTTWLSGWWPFQGAAEATTAASSPALPDDLAARNAQASELAASGEPEPVMAQPPAAPASLASAVLVGASSPSLASEPAPASPQQAADSQATAQSSPPAPEAVPAAVGALVLTAEEGSWVEIRQLAGGQKVMQRHLKAGETVSVDAPQALAVKIGNAGGVRVQYRGQPIELAAFTRNNVARLELK